MTAKSTSLPKPPWIRVRAAPGEALAGLRTRLRGLGLHTVCEAALCPNLGHCWSHGRATILILGDRCTRGCRFCNVDRRPVQPPAADEPARVARAVQASGLREVVLTSVTRDDLPDGGAALWAETIRAVQAAAPEVQIEVLVPDFGGNRAALDVVCDTRPAVFGHNLETVPRLYPEVRPEADYARSLALLEHAAGRGLITKTSLMLGLGETFPEVLEVLRAARGAGVRIAYFGQYLQPSPRHCPVARYLEPAEFERLKAAAQALGFDFVASAPLVRSSYHEDAQAEFVRRVASRT